MSINPLQAFPLASAVSEPGAAKKNSSPASFDALLSALRNPAAMSTSAGQKATADLFRIEMMQNSLSLAGDGVTARPIGLPAFEALLAGPTQYCPASPAPSPATAAPVAPLWNYAPVAAQPESASAPKLDAIEATAANYLGTPYRFGGEGADGIDCSSFVQKVFREHQIDLPRTAREQNKMGGDVAPGDLQKGDLVFFHTYADYPSHVGIYLGDGKMIHASSGRGEVTVSNLDSDYYRSRYLGAKRVA
jgi:cell wall-associated NlpC family hydrolase